MSDDGARTWEPAGFQYEVEVILAVKFHPQDPLTLFAGAAGVGEGGVLWATANGGQTWHALLRLAEVDADIRDIEFDPTDPDTMYVATSGTHETAKVLKTTDGGHSWVELDSEIADSYFAWDLAINPVNPSSLFLATDVGVYASSDAGRRWSPMNEGLFSTFATCVVIDPAGSAAFLGASGGGVFRIDL